MFKHRHIQVKFVKDNATADATGAAIPTPEEIMHHAEKLLKKVVVGTVVVIAATVVLTTASQIAVHAFDNTLTDNQ